MRTAATAAEGAAERRRRMEEFFRAGGRSEAANQARSTLPVVTRPPPNVPEVLQRVEANLPEHSVTVSKKCKSDAPANSAKQNQSVEGKDIELQKRKLQKRKKREEEVPRMNQEGEHVGQSSRSTIPARRSSRIKREPDRYTGAPATYAEAMMGSGSERQLRVMQSKDSAAVSKDQQEDWPINTTAEKRRKRVSSEEQSKEKDCTLGGRRRKGLTTTTNAKMCKRRKDRDSEEERDGSPDVVSIDRAEEDSEEAEHLSASDQMEDISEQIRADNRNSKRRKDPTPEHTPHSRRGSSHPQPANQETDAVMKCMDALNALKGVDGARYARALELFHSDHLWRLMFLQMPDNRKKDWLANLPCSRRRWADVP